MMQRRDKHVSSFAVSINDQILEETPVKLLHIHEWVLSISYDPVICLHFKDMKP